jgi:predicted TIM-barrel fold metal-dependent hydrolase
MSIQDPEAGAGLPQSLYMKARYPSRFFVFAGLNHAERLSGGKVRGPSLAEQADTFVKMGCDGIKMIEGKPTSRQRMDIPVTDPYFADYWACVEELGLPIVWHVNDPEEFWDPERIPGWAKERNWGYGPDDVQSEELYAEVDEVLARHPGLKIIFAHFYFLSADLARAARFFDEHPGVHFDLAPGIEMLYNISRDPGAGRDFFVNHADRILYGTDLSSGQTVEEARVRAGIVFRWLESDDTFRVPGEADFLLGPPEDGIIQGMSLPDDVLASIYRDNFVRLAGAEPEPLSVQTAIAECERLAAIAEALSGKPAAETDAAQVAERLADE